MIDRKQLLEDLQSLLSKTIEPDLRERSELPEIATALTEEFEKAKKAERTALNYTDWRADYITQIGVGWVLSCVFIRFLEDNDLIDPPKLSGPAQGDGDSQTSLQRARDEYDLYIKSNPTHSFREYILSCVDELAKLPGVSDVFGDKNVIHQQRDWLSNDAAKALYNFWQKIEPETGRLFHNFVDDSETETFDTRFLGDLYQDLSEAARKKYALLQTPDFVEEFILDRTLEPALEEFGLQPGSNAGERDTFFKIIDPACGSGHFLLGAFPRILRRWQQKEPGTKVDVLVQRTLHSIHGVDINPFAIAIARFRLLLASLKACGIERLRDAIDFDMSNFACGDSLYHGRQKQQTLGDWTNESHYFQTEDADNLKRILQEGTFHAVVANPPYITPKDDAANLAYRELYLYCHGRYSLAVPFMERIFALAVKEEDDRKVGYVGQITSNSFMKREFGKKLIEEFFLGVELTHILDVSGAYIPGHNGQEGGTSTVILFARNRVPFSKTIRTLMGIEGEPSTPGSPRLGKVWNAIEEQVDDPGTESRYVSSADTLRETFAKHPWSLGGGGLSDLIEELKADRKKLKVKTRAIGYGVNIGEDDGFVDETQNYLVRQGIGKQKPMPAGEQIRDYSISSLPMAIYPYDDEKSFDLPENSLVHFWCVRVVLRNALSHKKTNEERGLDWRQYAVVVEDKLNYSRGIIYAFVATHNHFVFHRQPILSTKSAPCIYLDDAAEDDDYLSIFGIVVSSVACLLLRNSTYLTGGNGEPWQMRGQFSSTCVSKLPVPSEYPLGISARIDRVIQSLDSLAPIAIVAIADTRLLQGEIESASIEFLSLRRVLVRLQEDLDWECYRLYGLLADSLAHTDDSFGINLGERAFEIVMARKMAAGELQTSWFEKHGSTPITEIPDHWPDDYKQLVQRRIDVIESNPQIALIEQPEYKRRWNTEPWESQVERALKSWLLDRLESYFDFDGRMKEAVSDQQSADSEEKKLNAESDSELNAECSFDIQLVSVARLADIASQDAQFMEVAEVYRDRADFDLVKLVDDLVSEEHVPALPILRYKPSGLDKRKAWEETWELQRAEDKIEARIREQLDGLLKMGGNKKDKQGAFRKDLPDDSSLLEFFSKPKSENTDKEEKKKKGIDDGFVSVDEIVRRCVKKEMGEIPVPPKYASKDMISTGGAKYWKLRGKLDVPKERWVSFPRCEGEDQTLVIAWAGYDHLQLLKAIAAYFADVQERGGSEDPRLVPLLAAMDQQIPWVKQWHNDIDPDFNMRLGDYFADFINDEARNLGLTLDDIRAWEPPKKVKKKRAKKKATKKKEEV